MRWMLPSYYMAGVAEAFAMIVVKTMEVMLLTKRRLNLLLQMMKPSPQRGWS